MMGNIRLAFTGHREQSGTYDPIPALRAALQAVGPDVEYCVSGMAEYWDIECAKACIDFGIPFEAALPYENFYSARKLFPDVLAKAWKITVVTQGQPYHVSQLFRRDEYMVDQASEVWSYYDGRVKGGTKHTIEYARQMGVFVTNFWRPS